MKFFLILSILTLSCASVSGQVLISLLLGDKLNSGKVEFGLDGGVSLSNLHGLHASSHKANFNLGFYFDIRMKNRSWMVHTGVMVKSTMGAKDISVYSLNNPDLDNAFAGGSVIRKLGYFQVPILMKHSWKNNFFVEAGPMFSLMSKAEDEFVASIEKKDDLVYKLKIRDLYHPLDAGLMGGVGYRLMGGNGMNLAIRYYYGLVDITLDDTTPNQQNRAVYFSVAIPIGAGKKNATKE
jgi:Outer membrane protein beta-barrel domain